MKEQTLKTWIFILLILGKLFIVLYLYIKTAVGGLTQAEAITAGAIILPLFVAYLTVVLEDFFRNPYKQDKTDKKQPKLEPIRVKGSVVIATFTIIPLYVLGFWIVLNIASHDAQFSKSLPKVLAVIESVLGVYVGIIIKSLFKEKKQDDK